MPVTNVRSTWVNGNLVFENVASGLDTLAIHSSGVVDIRSLKINGTALSATPSELNEIALSTYFAAASGDTYRVHMPMVHAGTVSKVYAINHIAASADGSCTLTVYCSATSAGTIEITSGQASGTIKSVALTTLNDVVASGQIMVTASGHAAALPMTITAVIAR